MEYVVKGYSPEILFNYFEDICAIPHGSGNEKGIADFLCRFADSCGLECYRDNLNNVLIKKCASKGYETHPAVLLQGHTDMVCEKNADTVHDFEKDSLKLVEKDGWLHADGTTLGADDGAGCALMMAILSDKTLKHPPLECLFTVSEETGMDGAFGFDYSHISAKSFINLDSETLDTATVSCAGGQRTEFTFDFEKYAPENTPVKITVKGLSGGHSGIDINSGRENANIIMAKVLGALYEKMPFNLISVNGGNKANAIPRECECVISVFDRKAAEEYISELRKRIAKNLVKYDKDFTLRVEKYKESFDFMFSLKNTARLVKFLNLLPNGVYSMSRNIEGLVETSSNIGVIATDGCKVKITVMPRSSNEVTFDELVMKFDMLGKLTGAVTVHFERYPGWEYKKESRVRQLFSECYQKKFGKKPTFEAIHAGLECGIINSKLGGNTDGVSICANVDYIHTPDEKMNLQSFSDLYDIVCDMLKNM